MDHGICGVMCSEVDLNRSLWYSYVSHGQQSHAVLKLTSTGHYGIELIRPDVPVDKF